MNVGILSKQVGPLPMGVWLLVGSGGLFIAYRKNKAGATDSAEPEAAAIDALPTGGGSAISSWDNAPVVLSPVVQIAPPTVVVNNIIPKPSPVVIGKPQPIAVPKPTPRVVKVAPKAAAKRRYTVVSGDTLYAIAKKQYGNPLRWPVIYAANTAGIEKAARAHGKPVSAGGHWIYPGTVLVIP